MSTTLRHSSSENTREIIMNNNEDNSMERFLEENLGEKPLHEFTREEMEAESRRTAKKRNRKKNQKSAGMKLKVVFGVLLACLIACGALVAFGMHFIDNKMDKVSKVEVERTNEGLGIDPQVAKDLKNYRNILFLGIDTRDVSNNKGSRSDAIVIASIDKKSDEIRLISVMRDTYLWIEIEQQYDKVTHAHAYGGAVETMKALNRGMDLNIEEVIVVNWGSIKEIVDAMGGLEVNVKENEIPEFNRYVNNSRRTIGGEAHKIEKAGKQTLDGVQAVTYARIRKGTSGGDQGRNERMRKLMKAALKKAKTMKLTELNKLADKMMPNIETNLESGDVLSLLMGMASYKITKSNGWPYDYSGWMPNGVWYGVGVTLESNVQALHWKYFNQANYQPTDNVEKYNEQICGETGWTEPGTKSTKILNKMKKETE